MEPKQVSPSISTTSEKTAITGRDIVGLRDKELDVEVEAEGKQINRSVEQSMILTHQIVRLLHQASVNKDVALSTLSAASSHVQCMNKADTV